jgi:hypothetical protein
MEVEVEMDMNMDRDIGMGMNGPSFEGDVDGGATRRRAMGPRSEGKGT